jgi:hypothetical protein
MRSFVDIDGDNERIARLSLVTTTLLRTARKFKANDDVSVRGFAA